VRPPASHCNVHGSKSSMAWWLSSSMAECGCSPLGYQHLVRQIFLLCVGTRCFATSWPWGPSCPARYAPTAALEVVTFPVVLWLADVGWLSEITVEKEPKDTPWLDCVFYSVLGFLV
jgi:hypothetical protein